MLRAQRFPALVVAVTAVSLSLWGVGYLPTAHAATAPTLQTYYFHGAGEGQDDVNRANSAPSATFDQTAPTGTSDSTQTGSVDANPESAGNPLSVYWESTAFRGHLDGTMHFDWYWSTANAESVVTGETATVTIYGDGTKIGQGDVSLDLGASPVLNHSDVTGVSGDVTKSLIVQVTMDHVDSGNAVTAHYNSTSAPSAFTVPVAPLPAPGSGGGYNDAPTCSGTFCFSAPIVLPKSGQTGGTSDTCFNPCGEPSLAVSPVDGTLYVSTPRTIVVCCNTQASPVWKSTDNGRTWSDPIFPSGAENATTGGDTELAVDKRGTVYEGELWLGSDSIYISSDKGSTWDWSPASHDVGADREWFAYSPTEDALYGWYDGFKGLMVVKAPLTTPLGTQAGKFFPQEQIAVPECAAAQATDCPGLPANAIDGKPIVDGTVSPGRPSVSPVDGTVYFPFPYQVAGKGIGIASTTDGINFTYNYVAGAGKGVLGDTGNDFPVSAVDAAGRLYVAWVENMCAGSGQTPCFDVYLASSGDKGATWTAPLKVSDGISKTAVFPNVVAGAAGQVAVSWYGTDVQGDNNTLPATASWNVYVTQITGAAGSAPTLTTDAVQTGFHTGVICTQGTNCTGTTRNLLDFFDMKFDKTGALGIVYTRDQFSNHDKTEIAYVAQTSGCVLTTADCAPTANLPEFPTEAAPVLLGAGLVGAFAVLRRRRRRTGLPVG